MENGLHCVLIMLFIKANGVYTTQITVQTGKKFYFASAGHLHESDLVVITSQYQAKVNVQIPGLNVNDSFTVPSGGRYVYNFPSGTKTYHGIEHKGIMITSDVDIMVNYEYRHTSGIIDMIAIHPISDVHTELILGPYPCLGTKTNDSVLVVIATANQTKVQVLTPTSNGYEAGCIQFNVFLLHSVSTLPEIMRNIFLTISDITYQNFCLPQRNDQSL